MSTESRQPASSTQPIPTTTTGAPATPARGQSEPPDAPVVETPAVAPVAAPVAAVSKATLAKANVTRPRTGDDVLAGHFARAVSGPFQGRYGVYVTTASVGADGFPVDVVFHTRDDRDEDLIVAYSDLRPAHAGER